jgi:hypothetical protein
MSRTPSGLLAGVAATIVLSFVMVMKAMMGLMPQLDLPKMLARMMGAPDSPMLGWLVHVVIGVVGYGLAMAFVGRACPGAAPSPKDWRSPSLAGRS